MKNPKCTRIFKGDTLTLRVALKLFRLNVSKACSQCRKAIKIIFYHRRSLIVRQAHDLKMISTDCQFHGSVLLEIHIVA